MSDFRRFVLYFFMMAASVAASRCTLEEDFLTDAGAQVRISADTLTFDTVFTEVGSATRFFKIFNPYDRPLQLASVRVEDGDGGRFRINVDGVSGRELKDVFIAPNDSLYVFAEVTVDPNEPLASSPFILEGRVVVRATTDDQSILLVAYGQNANYLPRSRRRGQFGLLTCDLGEATFDDPKPYVLYGSLVVDSCTMVLPAGARLYVHGGLVQDTLTPGRPIFNDGRILFFGSGRLRVEGTVERPVLIASDRLEEGFRQRPGQYSGLYFLSGTGPHVIRHADVRNGDFGIYVDSAAQLTVANTKVRYTAREGILGRQAVVTAQNVLIHDTGGAAFRAQQGGTYQFDYCTLVNYGGRNASLSLANGAEYERSDGTRYTLLAPLAARVRNSIVYGSAKNALGLVNFDEATPFSYDFRNVVLRLDEAPRNFPTFRNDCVDCLYPLASEKLFLNARQDSFQLDTLSVAEMKALPLPGVTTDLPGRSRDATAPDIGAYEYQYE